MNDRSIHKNEFYGLDLLLTHFGFFLFSLIQFLMQEEVWQLLKTLVLLSVPLWAFARRRCFPALCPAWMPPVQLLKS